MAKRVVRRRGSKTEDEPVEEQAQEQEAPKASSKATPKRMGITELQNKYPRVQSGSLEFDEAAGKQTVLIKCAVRGCKNERRVFTSDLFQVDKCEEHTAQQRRERRAEAARKRRASK